MKTACLIMFIQQFCIPEGVKFKVLCRDPGTPLHLMMEVGWLLLKQLGFDLWFGFDHLKGYWIALFGSLCSANTDWHPSLVSVPDEQTWMKNVFSFLQINPLKCSSVLQCYRTPTYSCYPKDSWAALCKKLFVGELIYPWKQKTAKTD